MDTFKLDKHVFTDSDISSVLSALQGVSRTLGDEKLDVALEKLVNIGLSRNKESTVNIGAKMIIDLIPSSILPNLSAVSLTANSANYPSCEGVLISCVINFRIWCFAT